MIGWGLGGGGTSRHRLANEHIVALMTSLHADGWSKCSPSPALLGPSRSLALSLSLPSVNSDPPDIMYYCFTAAVLTH